MTSITVNARFRVRPVTGVERVADEVLARLDGPTIPLQPPEWAAVGTAGHIWEQAVLPRRAQGTLWSPCNTGPLHSGSHVVTIHDTAPLREPEWFGRGFGAAYRFLIPRLCRSATAIVTVSDSVADELLALGAEVGRLHVIENGVSDWCRPAAAVEIDRVRRRWDLDDSPYFVALGSLDPRKNLGRLLEAWRGAQVGDAQLVLVGEAAGHVFREVTVDAHPRVRVLGRVGDADLAALLSGATALVSVSLYEGFGLPPIEALGCGTPVVVSDIPAHRTSTRSFDPTMVDPLDPASIRGGLESVLRDPPTVDSEGVRGRYSWAKAAAAYDALFAAVGGS